MTLADLSVNNISSNLLTEHFLPQFLANVNVSSCSLYVVARPSVCHLWSVCV